jgi:hypothetical protein
MRAADAMRLITGLRACWADSGCAAHGPGGSGGAPRCPDRQNSRRSLAAGESVIKCPSPLNVLKDTYDHSCYGARSDEYQHLMIDSPTANAALPLQVDQVLHHLTGPRGRVSAASVNPYRYMIGVRHAIRQKICRQKKTQAARLPRARRPRGSPPKSSHSRHRSSPLSCRSPSRGRVCH